MWYDQGEGVGRQEYWFWVTSNIERRSQNSQTASCNGIVIHGAQIGGTWDFAAHTQPKQTQTKRVHDLHVPCSV